MGRGIFYFIEIMVNLGINSYIDITRDTKVFKTVEIEVLKEVLEDLKNNPDTTYILFEQKEGDNLLGFIIFGKIPMTDFSWDIYWLVVDINYQGKGIGKNLLKRVEDFLVKRGEKVILRAETSLKKQYTAAHKFYKKMGFKEVGIIPDFYAEKDGLAIFSKNI